MPLHQGDYVAASVATDQQIILPMAWHGSVQGAVGPLTNRHHVRDSPRLRPWEHSSLRTASDASGSQMRSQLCAQHGCDLHKQRGVDRLVGHPHRPTVRMVDDQPAADLLRRPPQPQLVFHVTPQYRVIG